MSDMDSVTDVVELCAILQCLGFAVKSLDTSDGNVSQDGGTKTIVINCQSSGLHVVLESGSVSCSCPVADQQNSGFWQVSATTGGKHHDKETGSTLLRALPKLYRERLTKDLREMIMCIKTLNESNVEGSPALNRSASMVELGKNTSGSLAEFIKEENQSASMLELSTPEKRNSQLKIDTPTRYRSLDTLKDEVDPTLRMLQKQVSTPASDFLIRKKASFNRQSTYTIPMNQGSAGRRNKTSSPIRTTPNNLLDNLIEAEKAAEGLRNNLTAIIRDLMEDARDDSSISSMLDVSKISVLKGTETSKAQFASSPNLSGLGTVHKDFAKSGLRRSESASTSNLLPKPTPDNDSKSRFRRISPNIFKQKDGGGKTDKGKDGKSKLQNMFKSKIAAPVRAPRATPEPSPNFSSASKKKFSHVKSTIPRLTPKKDSAGEGPVHGVTEKSRIH